MPMSGRLSIPNLLDMRAALLKLNFVSSFPLGLFGIAMKGGKLVGAIPTVNLDCPVPRRSAWRSWLAELVDPAQSGFRLSSEVSLKTLGLYSQSI